MYESGADIIWHSGDGIGLGVVEAAKEKGVLVLGNVADQHKLAPQSVLSGVVYKWDAVIRAMIEDLRAGRFGKKKYWITFGNDGLSLAPFRDLADRIPEAAKTKVEEVRKQLAEGRIEFPEFEKQK